MSTKITVRVHEVMASTTLRLLAAMTFAMTFAAGCLPDGQDPRDRRRDALTAVGQIERAVDEFKDQHQGRCPRDFDELIMTRIIKRVPDDPWGRSYWFECSAASLRACSRGPDELAPDDDVCSDSVPRVPERP